MRKPIQVVFYMSLLLILTTSDYFSGLTLKQTLIDDANKAMVSLKHGLES